MKTRILALILALCALTLLTATPAHAGSATWSSQPINGNWNDSQNWSPQTVPNGPSDVATMGSSFNRTVSLSANTEVNGLTFPFNRFTAVNYAITVGQSLTLTISGTGITNSSGQAQNFVIAGGDTNVAEAELFFTNNATAGSAIFTNNAPTVTGGVGGVTEFFDSATAGNSTFINNADGEIEFSGTASAGSGTFTSNGGGTVTGFGGHITFESSSTAANAILTNNGGTVSGALGGGEEFFDTSTAGSATITNNGGMVSGAGGGGMSFQDTSDAGSATITSNGAAASGAGFGETVFGVSSSAGSATVIANGGTNGGDGSRILFLGDSAGGFARIEVFGNGNLDISGHNAPGVGTGSIQGNGIVFLGANNLTVGLNNLSTVFSGVAQDRGFNGNTGGSLTKIGKGKLTLSHANTYTGGTALNGGTLLVKNKTGSGTGAAGVQVNSGILGGTGIMSGAVTVGTGTTSGAILLGGNSATVPGTLTINNILTLNSLCTFKCGLKRTTSLTGQVTAVAGKVTALGVTINSNVPFTLVDSGTGTLPVGTVLTIINNTSANPIAGRFSNLAAGLTFTSNGNNFKVSYTGGTGNDLTLKVVQ